MNIDTSGMSEVKLQWNSKVIESKSFDITRVVEDQIDM